MNDRLQGFPLRLTLALAVSVLCSVSEAGLMATLSLENVSPAIAAPGDTVSVDVWLRDLETDLPTDFVESFQLDFSASDASLTSDYSSYQFTLAADLTGIIGGNPFDVDASDDGIVVFGADTFWAAESGVLASMGDRLLGRLQLQAPALPGTYTVGLAQSTADPFAGSYLSVNDGTFSGKLMPSDGTLTTNAVTFDVQASGAHTVPEPTSIWAFSAVLLAGGYRIRRKRDQQPPLGTCDL